ncbi:small ribosomal subunit protein uS10m isoform X6 [Callithrix jacchus]|uniref:28S ribosomal protein S10, mitochondrial isoform X5 n=1 Tax=Callithrix jacchus TaxID=9483 RepID=UPI0023DD21D4|nr:28S ribosomal protein S10, mitochondrial isoform X5 [Callithrix jacchus]
MRMYVLSFCGTLWSENATVTPEGILRGRERQDGGANRVRGRVPALLITISDEPDTLYKRLSVLVKGHDKAVLDSYEYFAVLAAKELGISIKVHEPPRKIERFTLLKSVHIYKKHRVQYEMRTLYRCLELEHLTGSTADVYLEYIQRNLPEGVAMEVTKTQIVQLPEHIKEPIWETVSEEKEENKS